MVESHELPELVDAPQAELRHVRRSNPRKHVLVLSLRLTGFGPNLARGARTTRSTEALSWRVGSAFIRKRGGVTDDRIHASTDARPIARCLRYGRPAPINSDANPAAKRPNAIHLDCMVNLVGSPPNPRDVRLRHVMSGCNRVVSQCEMAGASGWVNNAPTAGAFRVGRREARYLSERWPARPAAGTS